MNAATLSLTLTGLLLAGVAPGAADAAEDDAASAKRVTRSAEGFARDHADDELRDPRSLEETTIAPEDLITKPRARANRPTIAAVFGDSYIYEASTDLFYDYDGDGYFHHLRVRFDADTVFDTSWIYAKVFVSADGSTWEQVYETDDFVIHGSDPEDDYEVETELVSGYIPALYDLLVELYDADDGTLVDEFGPNESSDFSLLPLEDSVRDGAEPDPGPDVIGDDGGGGATSWPALAPLFGALFWKRRRRAREAARAAPRPLG